MIRRNLLLVLLVTLASLFPFQNGWAQLTFSVKWIPSEVVYNAYIQMDWDQTDLGTGVISLVNGGRDIYNTSVEPVNNLVQKYGRHEPVDSMEKFDPVWDVRIGKGTHVRSMVGIGFAGNSFEVYTLVGGSETHNKFPFIGWEATVFPLGIFTDGQLKELVSISRLFGLQLRANVNTNDPFLFEWGWGLSGNLDLAVVGERLKLRGYYRMFREQTLIKGENNGLLRTQALGLSLLVSTTNRKTQGQRLPLDIWAGPGYRLGKMKGPAHIEFSEKAIKSAGNAGLDLNELAFKGLVQLGNKVGYEVNLDTTLERLRFDTIPGVDEWFSEGFWSVRVANDEKYGKVLLDLQMTHDKKVHVDGYVGLYPLAFLSAVSGGMEAATRPQSFFFAKWFPRRMVSVGLAASFINRRDPKGFRTPVRVGPYAEVKLPVYFTRNLGLDISVLGRRFVSRKDGGEGEVKFQKTDFALGLHGHLTIAKVNSQEKDLLEAYDLYDKEAIQDMNKDDRKKYRNKIQSRREKQREQQRERKKKKRQKKDGK